MHKTRYHFLEETTSTNDEARDAKYRHGDIVWAERQTAGRGQRGHKWSSAEGLNLTFSLVLEPRFLPVGEQFLLSEAVTLALTDTFAAYGIDTRIKWTNDIYAGDKKLVGILIEHSYSGQTLARTIVGIGINVNQTEFDPALPNPVSMAMVAGRTFDRGEVLEAFRRQITVASPEQTFSSFGALREWISNSLLLFTQSRQAAASQDTAVATVKAYIESHLSDELDRDTLAAMVYLNADYLSHLFKKDTGSCLLYTSPSPRDCS